MTALRASSTSNAELGDPAGGDGAVEGHLVGLDGALDRGRGGPRLSDHVGRIAERVLVVGELIRVVDEDGPVDAANHIEIQVDAGHRVVGPGHRRRDVDVRVDGPTGVVVVERGEPPVVVGDQNDVVASRMEPA